MRLEYHPSSVDDFNRAVDYYRSQRPGLELKFEAAIDAAVAGLVENPQQFPIVHGTIRRCLVNRFPYSILFRQIDGERLRILAFRHHKRHSGFGRRK